MTTGKRKTSGIEPRHRKDCPALENGRCACEPAYRAEIFDRQTGQKIRRTFPTHAAAKAWRQDAVSEQRRGLRRTPTSRTVRAAAEDLIEGLRDGTIRNRSGHPYKPSAVSSYEEALRRRIVPAFGTARLSELTRADIQTLVDRMLREGLSPSTVRNLIMPLRVIYRRAIVRGEVPLNPCDKLEVPAVRGRRDRIATSQEAAALIAALVPADRALWAVALYAGLRRGEIAGLRWDHIDLNRRLITVETAYDYKSRSYVAPKSDAGNRRVPIISTLAEALTTHGALTERSAGLVFGRDGTRPFDPSSTRARAHRDWAAAGVNSIELHEARHTFASLMIAAGVAPKALQVYMGHSSIRITFDRYGHLMPGNEAEAANLLERYITLPSDG